MRTVLAIAGVAVPALGLLVWLGWYLFVPRHPDEGLSSELLDLDGEV